MTAPVGGLDLTRHLERLTKAAERAATEVADATARYARMALETLAAGGRILYCGNGGSAAITEHIATEYTVRYRRQRGPLPATSLSSGAAALTATANDFGFDQVFARALRAHARPGDLLVLHSTSGDSPNVLEAARAAPEIPVATVALTGESGGELAGLVDVAIRVPSNDTACIQELHLAIEHAVADFVDAHFAHPGGEPR